MIKDEDRNEVAYAFLDQFGYGDISIATRPFLTVNETKAFANGLVVLTQGGIHDDGGPLPTEYEIED
jgi:hypothetical protein